MNTDTKSAPSASVNQTGTTDHTVAPANKAVRPRLKAVHAAKTTKAPQRPPRSSRAGFGKEKLV